MGERARRRGWEGRLSWVGAWTFEILPDSPFEFDECLECDVELLLQVRAHLAFHLGDLPESEHTLTDDALINAEMKRRCPEEPRAAMNRSFSLRKR